MCSVHNSFLWGIVKDASTGKPIPYASARIADSNVGTVSNEEGLFSLKINENEGIVRISCLGYSTVNKNISNFDISNQEKPLTINLVPTSLFLDPSVIRSVDPFDLLNYAFSKIPQNYTTRSHETMTAFYREKIRKGSTYLSVSEAVLNIDKSPYYGLSYDKAVVYKGRSVSNMNESDTLLIKEE